MVLNMPNIPPHGLKEINYPYFRRALPVSGVRTYSIIREFDRIDGSVAALKNTYVQDNNAYNCIGTLNNRCFKIPIWDGFGPETVRRLRLDNEWRILEHSAGGKVESWIPGFHSCPSSLIDPSCMPNSLFTMSCYRLPNLYRNMISPIFVIDCDSSNMVAGYTRDVNSGECGTRHQPMIWSAFRDNKACWGLKDLQNKMYDRHRYGRRYTEDWSEVFLLYNAGDVRGLEMRFPLQENDFIGLTEYISIVRWYKEKIGIINPVTLAYVMDIDGGKVYEIPHETLSAIAQADTGSIYAGIVCTTQDATKIVEEINEFILNNRAQDKDDGMEHVASLVHNAVSTVTESRRDADSCVGQVSSQYSV